ncbi:MAG: FAD-dependent oxidoreductase, partial [Thermoguttaceae bacterium]|nr:FAD-dependent oxidoreductase [Thermoguttaceae bacterium]
TAAVLAIDHKIAVQDVDYPQLRERLLADHQILDYKPGIDAVEFVAKHSGILIDDQQAGYVGEWNESRAVSPFMEYGYRHDLGTQDGEKSATFSTTIESPGDYEVFISYTTNGNRATNVPVEIIHQKGTTCVTVNEQKNPEFANLFHSLGTFTFDEKATVTVSNRDVNGHVIVDAVWFLKR